MKTKPTYTTTQVALLTLACLRITALAYILSLALSGCARYDGECFPKPDKETARGTIFINFPQAGNGTGTRNTSPNPNEGGQGLSIDAWDRVNNEHVGRFRVIIFHGNSLEVNELWERYTYNAQDEITGITEKWKETIITGDTGTPPSENTGTLPRNGVEITVSIGFKTIYLIANEHPSQTNELNNIRSPQALLNVQLPRLGNPLDNNDQFFTGSPVYQLFNDKVFPFTEKDPVSGSTITVNDRGTWFIPMTGQAVVEVKAEHTTGISPAHVDITLTPTVVRILLSTKLASGALQSGGDLYLRKVTLTNNVRQTPLFPNYNVNMLPKTLGGIPGFPYTAGNNPSDYYDLVMDYTLVPGLNSGNGFKLTHTEEKLPHSPTHNNHLLVYENLAGVRTNRATQLILTVWDGKKETDYSVFINEDVDQRIEKIVEAVEMPKGSNLWWATRNVGDQLNTFADKPQSFGGKYRWNNGVAASAWPVANNPCPPYYRLPTLIGTEEKGAINITGGELYMLRYNSTANAGNPTLITTYPNVPPNATTYSGGIWTNSYEGTGVSGRVYGVYPNQIFLPAAGATMMAINGKIETLTNEGAYWSTFGTLGGVASFLRISTGNAGSAIQGNTWQGNELGSMANSYASIRCVRDSNPHPDDGTHQATESVVKFNAVGIDDVHHNFLLLRGHCYHLDGEINNFSGQTSHFHSVINIAPRYNIDQGNREIGGWK